MTPVYLLPDDGLTLHSRAGVFSAGKLDGGAALLLRHLPATRAAMDAADLGCGDGVLALALARRCPLARITGVDESHLAVACARDNLARNFRGAADIGRVRFEVGDGLCDSKPESLDLVVCNPPFHQGLAVADVAAARMFAQAYRALRPHGLLLVVGNRHLGHHAKLESIFGHHQLVDGDGRFTVVSAHRR